MIRFTQLGARDERSRIESLLRERLASLTEETAHLELASVRFNSLELTLNGDDCGSFLSRHEVVIREFQSRKAEVEGILEMVTRGSETRKGNRE